jgi:SAM-dependent methyltransferase
MSTTMDAQVAVPAIAAEVGPEPIFQVAQGFMASKHLFTANEVGLFAALADGPLAIGELAARTAVPAWTLRIVADAVAALGFVEKGEDGTYRNAPVAQAFLAGRGAMDLRPFLRFWNRISYPHWTRLEDAVRTGERQMHGIAPELERVFSEGVNAITAGPAHALAEGYDFGRHRAVADLGGGFGVFLSAVLARWPHLRGTLFDLPHVAEGARAAFAGDPSADRVTVLAGDLVADPLPAGHDAVILANVLHYFDPQGSRALLRRIRGAVEPGGRLLAVDFWTDASRTQPLPAALMGGEFLVLQGGDVYAEAQAREWLAATGWRHEATIPLVGPLAAVVAEAV